jgi:hypothetical protein
MTDIAAAHGVFVSVVVLSSVFVIGLCVVVVSSWVWPPKKPGVSDSVWEVSQPNIEKQAASVAARARTFMDFMISPEKQGGPQARHALRRASPGKQKKPTQQKPEDSGFDCVGLLTNGSSSFWLDYPLFSHPRTSRYSGEPIGLRLHQYSIVRRMPDEVYELPKYWISRSRRITSPPPDGR